MKGRSPDLTTIEKTLWAWDAEGISAWSKLLLLRLADITDQDGYTRGTVERFSRGTGMSGFIAKRALNMLAQRYWVELSDPDKDTGQITVRLRVIETRKMVRAA